MPNDPTPPDPLERGAYRALVTDAGAGWSRYGDLALTRWTGDRTREPDGFFLYVRDLETGARWSAGLQPVSATPERYLVRRSADEVRIARVDEGIELTTAVRLAPEGDAELRRYTIVNRGPTQRRLELTTYAEAVLNTPGGDAGHPAFSKLFVQTEYAAERQALLARRRPRSPEDEVLWLVHLLVPGEGRGTVEWETDRMRFIGRGRSLADPRALDRGARLSGTTGNVLDPVLALRRVVALDPGARVRVTAVLGAGATREAVDRLAVRYTSANGADKLFEAPDESEATETDLTPGALLGTRSSGLGTRPSLPGGAERRVPSAEALQLWNGHGGFSADGTEYVIRVEPGEHGPVLPPLPWTNVVANESLGFLVSERGAAFTWSANSRENRLTPWHNDPVADPHGEALWLRDEEAGVFWSPTPGPTPAAAPYEVRHGFGYTVVRHESHDLAQETWQYVPRHDPVKLVRLRVTNRGDRPRRLSAFAYFHLVLGVLPDETAPTVVVERDEGTGALLATNPANGEFAHRVAFAAAAGPDAGGPVHVTADRAAFLGRYGSPAAPAALSSEETLDGRTGGGLDPCAALQVPLEVAPGATAEVVFLLGQDESAERALALVRRYREPEAAAAALDEARRFWTDLLGAVRIETPSKAIDLAVNGWLAYQNLACRMWGRSAFYQSGGAFGYRDQLQDSSALLYLDPAFTRRQIVLHAAHQFVEGDVLHWWHPPTSKGIRTRFADDLLWLPYVTAFYVRATGDASVLDEPARFVAARHLEPGEDEAFLVPADSGETADVYEHCCRVLDRGLTAGAHGLPLMGTGDWNDGMNRVGREGRGESVWLGFFIATVLDDFLPIVERRGDAERAARWRAYRARLAAALNDGGWDGDWYRRAYYDDGTPLGSASGDECRIDAIAQAWAVISRVAPADRAAKALDALERHLVSEDEGIIRLLTPAFDRTPHDPGYIKGYLPGVRENGGQYTHGALWAVRALAEHGRADRAARLLEMLSPVSHGRTPEEIAVYQTEPYVIAADVYGVPPHTGRGGWTWYTGSAGWFCRVALESVLGLSLHGGTVLALEPCIPAEWPGFTVRMRLGDGRTVYALDVRRGDGASTSATLNGEALAAGEGRVEIPLVRDGAEHRVSVVLGADAGPRYSPRG